MKKLSVKKIAALAAGAVMLGAAVVGAAYWQDVPITNDAGAPQVKVVVGANAAASDGVAAANIAATIGNLAFASGTTYTAVPVGLDGVSCQKVAGTAPTTGSATCTPTVSNEQVQLDVTLPGVITGAYNFQPSINDYIDKKLNNRVNSNPEDMYQSGVTDVSPFAAQDVMKVDGTEFAPLASTTVVDTYAGNSYTEEQSLWVRGQVAYDETLDTLVAKSMKLAYRAEFTQDSYGIPFCTTLAAGAGNDYTQCQSDNDRTDRHRVSIKFLGEDWIISAMSVPDNSSTGGTGTAYIDGSSVSLAKEAAYRVLHIGENLTSGAYTVRLSDIGLAVGINNDHPAAIEIYDANGVLLKEDQITPGTTYSWLAPDGTNLKIRVYSTQPGYTLNSKWAEMAVYSQEVTLTSGDSVDNDVNTDWDVSIGWRDKDFVLTAPQADHLREILLVDDSFTNKLQKGDTLDIIGDPVVFQLEFDGVNLASADYNTVQYSMDNDADLKVSNTTSGQSCDVSNTVSLSSQKLLQVTGQAKDSFEIDGYSVNNFYVNLLNSNDTVEVYYKPSGVSCWYNSTVSTGTALNPDQNITTIKMSGLGDDTTPANGGVLLIENTNFTSNPSYSVGAIEDAGYNGAARTTDTFNVTLSQDTGGKWRFTPNTGSNNNDVMTYIPAAPGSQGLSAGTVNFPYMTERGTKVYDVDTTGWSFDAATKLGAGNFYFKSQGTATNSATQVTLKEGESATLQGGVTIKADSITETVGSCSVDSTGASVSCQATGLQGVTAQIKEAGAATVTAVTPYKLTDNLVELDTNAQTTGTLISVGGDAVNTVSKAALATGDTPVNWDTTPVVVKKYGNTIVVAGKTADDTASAAAQFISQLK